VEYRTDDGARNWIKIQTEKHAFCRQRRAIYFIKAITANEKLIIFVSDEYNIVVQSFSFAIICVFICAKTVFSENN
jgi:predicted HAD superfamily hydrolase